MPFKSKKQEAYLWANDPEVARKFVEDAAREHVNSEKLPEQASKPKRKPKRKPTK